MDASITRVSFSTAALVCAAALCLSARQAPMTRPAGTPAQARIYFAAPDALPPLTTNDVQVMDGDERVAVERVGPAEDAPSVVVVMHGFVLDQAGDARKALTALMQTLRAGAPHTRIAIIGDVLTPTLTDITTDAAALDATARRFATSGLNMNYFESVVDAAKTLQRETTRRRAVITFTNANRQNSDIDTYTPTVTAFRRSMASLWAVDITPDLSGQTQVQEPRREMSNFLSTVPGESGGRLVRVNGTLSLDAVATDLATAILGQYELTWTRGASAQRDTTLRIGVRGVPPGKLLAPGYYFK